jgi:hypothetical protein
MVTWAAWKQEGMKLRIVGCVLCLVKSSGCSVSQTGHRSAAGISVTES